MYFVHADKRYDLIEVDNDYFTLAKKLGMAGKMRLKPDLSNMNLSQLLDVCNCTLEMLPPSDYQEYLDQRVRQIKTFEVLPLYLDVVLLVIKYHDLLDLKGFCYQHGLTKFVPSIKEYGNTGDKILLTYNSFSNKLFLLDFDLLLNNEMILNTLIKH
jgi:hypothetical protein